jgi:hypothetical protein
MRNKSKWIAIRLLGFLLAFFCSVGILTVAFGFGPPVWSQEAAGWIQAVGSIAAIGFAYLFGERQATANLESVREANRLDAKRRYDSIIALAESAEVFTKSIAEVFQDGQFGYLALKFRYREEVFGSLVASVKAVSAQDLGSYNAVLAFVLLQEALVNFQSNVKRALDFVENQRNPVTGAVNNLQDWDAESLHMCGDQVGKTIKILRDYRPDFAT